MPAATRIANVLSLLGAFVATAMVMGLLGAGLVLPAVGATGQATKSGVSMFNGLPSEFEVNPLNQQSRILAKDGSVIATPYDENRIVVPLSKMAPVMRNAQVAIEDKRFYEHGGIDPQGLARAVVSNVVSGGTQGASTLTQQYVKVVQQDQALKRGDDAGAAEAISRSGTAGYLRKLQQLKYSVTLEGQMTKNQILEGYLNTVYMGDQQYGVEAAARHYFNVPASKLNVQQAATLAGVVQRPGATDPVHNPEAAKNRRNTVLKRMYEQKMITEPQYTKAVASPLGLNITNSDQSCASAKYSYFCYYIQNWLSQQPSLGKTPKDRLAKLRSGGLTIQTSLDPKKMAIIDKQLKAKVPVGNESDVQAAAVQIEPGTGMVVAMGQNTTYSNAKKNGATSVNYAAPSGASSLGFPVGSSGKIFAIIEALKQGRGVESTIDVPKMTGRNNSDTAPAAVFTSKLFNDDCGLGRRNTWKVGNQHTVPAGPMSLTEATKMSINTAFAELTGDLGACKVRDTWTQFGVTKVNGKPIGKYPSNIVLGTDSSSPLQMANAYATIAAGGKYCTPRPVVSIKQGNGKALKLSTPPCKQVISPELAAGVAKIFHSPLQEGGTAAKSKLAGGRDAFGKTGTTQQAEATWFIGSTPQLTTSVFVGRANDHKALENLRLGSKYYSGYIFADTLAAPIWKGIMDASLKGTPKTSFDKVTPQVEKGTVKTPPAKPSSGSTSPDPEATEE